MKIVTTPNSKSTDENKENIQGQERGSIPMDVSESSASQATETSTKGESGANPNAAEAEMDVDCSISENDWMTHIIIINYQRNYCSFFFYYFWHFFVMSWKDFLLRYLPILLDFSELFCLLALQKWIFISNSRHIKYRLKNHNIARETRTQPKIGWMMIKKFCEKLSVYTRVKRKKSLLEKINENRYQSYTKSNHIKILELPQKTLNYRCGAADCASFVLHPFY